MTPERWSVVKRLFNEACERPVEERAAFLDEACSGDVELRAEVDALVRSDDAASDFMDTPAPMAAGAEASRPVRQVGPYRIVREIGHGGMGAVYLATRADSEYKKDVALKILPMGLDSELAQERFRNERQILASLQHPYIAALHDGGTTEDGLLYFVMEYVPGEDVLSYCDRGRLTIPERLALFRKICSAVQYAHQNLVIHRDIKPGNIFVTESGDPKLLDFGISKLVDPLSGTSDLTEASFRVMTPEYASPEQVRGDRITTASDVYSLGVLLYALLTGRLPYTVENSTPTAMIRSVCESEPERPSLAGIRPDNGAPKLAAPEIVAEARSTTPGALRRALSGDLDNILLTALRKEPERRYQSVERLSEDIRRHLTAMPVSARPDTLRYRAGKYIARHKALFAAGSVVAATLIGGLVATSWQASVARRERLKAERRFEDVRKLATAFLFEFHDAIADLEGATAARSLVVKKALEYLDDLAAEAGADLSLQRELAAAYFRVATIQHESDTGTADESKAIMASYQKALAIRDQINASGEQTIDDIAATAEVLGWISSFQSRQGRYAEALDLGLRALSYCEQVARSKPDDKEAGHILAAAYHDLSYAYVEGGDAKNALVMAEKEQALFEKLAKRHALDPNLEAGVGYGHRMAGIALRELARPADAVVHHEAALQIFKRVAAADPTNLRFARQVALEHEYMAQCHEDLGELAHAYIQVRSALTLREAMAASDPGSARLKVLVASTRCDQARVLSGLGRSKEALRELTASLATLESESDRDAENTEVKLMVAEAYEAMEIVLSAAGKGAGSGDRCVWLRRSVAVYDSLAASGALSVSSAKAAKKVRSKLEEQCG